MEGIYLIWSIILCFGIKNKWENCYKYNNHIKIGSILYGIAFIVTLMINIVENYILWYFWYIIVLMIVACLYRLYNMRQYYDVYDVIKQLNSKYEINDKNKSIANNELDALDATWKR